MTAVVDAPTLPAGTVQEARSNSLTPAESVALRRAQAVTPWREYRGGKIFFTCAQCRRPGSKKPSECTGNHKFCSQKCANDFRSDRANRDRCLAELSGRERAVFDALLCGATKKQAGDRVGISPSLVSLALRRIYRKLGVASLVELGAFAARMGIPVGAQR